MATEVIANDSNDDGNEEMELDGPLSKVENILGYTFKDRKLLKEALTHSSVTNDTESYQRLEFLGDAVIGLAVSKYLYETYPTVDPGELSSLRAANISTEKFARAAVHCNLFRYIQHASNPILHKIEGFATSVKQEDGTEVYGGLVKAPKILADIFESIAAAIYVDTDFSMNQMWKVVSKLLAPIVTLDMVKEQPQPVAMLFEVCQTNRKCADIRYEQKGKRSIASVYIDGELLASASSEQKEMARFHAAKAALSKLPRKNIDLKWFDIFNDDLGGQDDIDQAKHKLYVVCGKKKWSNPGYKLDQEFGRDDEKRYVCTVKVDRSPECEIMTIKGNAKRKIKDAQRSAASAMIRKLHEMKLI